MWTMVRHAGLFLCSVASLAGVLPYSNLFIEGRAFKEKVSFTIQMNYSSSQPLVEAFIGYHIDNSTTIYFGKRQVFHNNLEMTHNEDMLRFTDTSLLGQNYTQSSEEFGIFVEASKYKSVKSTLKDSVNELEISADDINKYNEILKQTSGNN